MVQGRAQDAVVVVAAAVVAQILDFLFSGDKFGEEQVRQVSGCDGNDDFNCQESGNSTPVSRVADENQHSLVGGGQKDGQQRAHGDDASGVEVGGHDREAALGDTAKEGAHYRACLLDLCQRPADPGAGIVLQTLQEQEGGKQEGQHADAVLGCV